MIVSVFIVYTILFPVIISSFSFLSHQIFNISGRKGVLELFVFRVDAAPPLMI